MADSIGGTVIQRSFVGREIPNVIHAATVPAAELRIRSRDVEDALPQLLGIPRASIVTPETFRSVTRTLQDYPPDVWWPYVHPELARRVMRPFYERRGEHTNQELFEDYMALVSSSAANLVPPSPPIWMSERSESQSLEASIVASQVIAARAYRTQSLNDFIGELLRYELPLGQSPAVAGDSLLKLLETSRKFCIAPLALGGAQAVNQLSQGNYVGALLTTGTAGVMTLVLIGTVSVGALIVQKVAQLRASGGSSNSPERSERPRDRRPPRRNPAGAPER